MDVLGLARNDRSILLTRDYDRSKDFVGNKSVLIACKSTRLWFHQNTAVLRRGSNEEEKELFPSSITSTVIFFSFPSKKKDGFFQFAYSVSMDWKTRSGILRVPDKW
jgi:hypothetical protein